MKPQLIFVLAALCKYSAVYSAIKKVCRVGVIRILFFLGLLGVFPNAIAQQPGTVAYSFINLPYAAKLGGLGGVTTSLLNADPTLFLSNPALATDSMSNKPSVNITLLPNTTNLSTAAYSRNFKKLGLFSIGVQYVAYGTLAGYSDTGTATSSFKPHESALTLSYARQANNFRLGASIKQVGANIADYKNIATLFDMGGVFIHPSQRFTLALAIKNVGFQWKRLSQNAEVNLPFDVQLGTTIKPEHMPFRFSVTLYKLYKWDLTQPNEQSTNAVADNLMRHVVLGAELLLSNHINLLFGYNHLRRKELKLNGVSSFSGFSTGLAVKTRLFDFEYAFGGYHVAGNANMFSLRVDMNKLIKK